MRQALPQLRRTQFKRLLSAVSPVSKMFQDEHASLRELISRLTEDFASAAVEADEERRRADIAEETCRDLNQALNNGGDVVRENANLKFVLDASQKSLETATGLNADLQAALDAATERAMRAEEYGPKLESALAKLEEAITEREKLFFDKEVHAAKCVRLEDELQSARRECDHLVAFIKAVRNVFGFDNGADLLLSIDNRLTEFATESERQRLDLLDMTHQRDAMITRGDKFEHQLKEALAERLRKALAEEKALTTKLKADLDREVTPAIVRAEQSMTQRAASLERRKAWAPQPTTRPEPKPETKAPLKPAPPSQPVNPAGVDPLTSLSRLAKLHGPAVEQLTNQEFMNPDEVAQTINADLSRSDQITAKQVSQVLQEMARHRRGAA